MQHAIRVAALFVLLSITSATAQLLEPVTPLCGGSPCFTASNPGNITGSFSATLSGFTPGGTFATLTATNAAGTVALPAGTVVAFQNTGTTTVSCTVNTGAAAVANEIQVPASSTVFITVGANTSGSCIDQTGSTSNLVVLAGGSGLGTGFGGGGGGGGSSGAVFGPTAVGSANANPPVVIGGTVTGAAGQNVEGVAVKPASTAPLATDFALVTVESPNSPVVSALINGPITQAHTCATSGYGVGSCLGAINDSLATLNTTAGNSLAAQANHTTNIGAVDSISDYPGGATPTNGSNTGTTAATSTTLGATASVTQFVCWISIRANATAVATGNATLSDGTKTFNFTQWTAPNASGVGVVEEVFPKCVPASAVNTAWTLTSAAPGAGGVVSVAIGGYTK